MENFTTGSSSASVDASITSPVVIESSVHPPGATPNSVAGETPSVDLTNETDETAPSAKRSKKLTSDVWDHFTKYDVTKVDDDGNKVVEPWASCNSKGCTYKGRRTNDRGNRGTTVFRTHLQNKHHIITGQQKLVMEKVEGKESMAAPATFRYDEAVSLRLFYLSIIMHEYPFNIVEHDYLVKFIHSLRPSFPIKSRPCVKKDIVNIYKEEKAKLYDYFKTLQCRFSTTMDMWTSGQNKGYMCITAHWIDDNWCMQKRIIKFMNVEGQHSGKNLALHFYDCIVDWNLDRRLLALSLDNAAANDKCAETLVMKFNKKTPLICDGVFFHVRCLNHILNLVAQDGLKTIGKAISNIRNTVSIVKNSTQQYEEFKKCALECDLNENAELSLDVPTRWNSTYDMLKAATYFRDVFDRLFLRHKKKYKHCAPTSKNWLMASKISNCLKLFADATKLFSGNKYPTANLFFISFCKIKIAISEWCASSDPVIKSMAHSMKLKYEKYWEKSNMALAVACFFDPRYKRNVIEYYAPMIYPTTYEEEIAKFTKVVDQLFEAYVSVSKKATSSGTNVCQTSAQHTFIVDDGLDSFLNSKIKGSVCGMKTELEIYMEQDLVPRTELGFNILSWWKDHQVEYPILSKLARDILSIQVSTVASESAFSAGGRVVDPFRSRLDPETVQALICTKDWIAASEGNLLILPLCDMLCIM